MTYRSFSGSLAAIITAILYGSTGGISKALSVELAPWYQLFLQSILATIFAFFVSKGFFSTGFISREGKLIAVRAIALTLFGEGCFLLAVFHTQMVHVALIYIFPFSPVCASLIRAEKLSPEKTASVLIGALGAIIVLFPQLMHSSQNSHATLYGDLLATLSGLGFGFGFALSKFHAPNTSENDITLGLSLCGTLLVALSLVWNSFNLMVTEVTDLSGKGCFLLLAGGAITYVTTFLLNYSLARISIFTFKSLLYLETVTILLVGIIMFHESIGLTEMVGGVLILIASISAFRIEMKAKTVVAAKIS